MKNIDEQKLNDIQEQIQTLNEDEFLELILKRILGYSNHPIQIIELVCDEINQEWERRCNLKGEKSEVFTTKLDLVDEFFDKNAIGDKIGDRWFNEPDSFFEDSWYYY